jgi:putative holliday junction resolvase
MYMKMVPAIAYRKVKIDWGLGSGDWEKHINFFFLPSSLTPHPSSMLEPKKLPISALGLDVGSKRIGVAGCDGLGLMATGLTTIQRSYFTRDLELLRNLVIERQATILVVGLPYLADGELGSQAKQIQKLAKKFGKALNLPVEYVAERLASYEAEDLIKAERISPSRNKSLIDRKAAAIILQQWLNMREN